MVSNSLEGVPRSAEHLLAAFPSLCGTTHPKPSQLGLGQVIVMPGSSNVTLHYSTSTSWSKQHLHSWQVFGVTVLFENK